jgi:hypothetical protein
MILMANNVQYVSGKVSSTLVTDNVKSARLQIPRGADRDGSDFIRVAGFKNQGQHLMNKLQQAIESGHVHAVGKTHSTNSFCYVDPTNKSTGKRYAKSEERALAKREKNSEGKWEWTLPKGMFICYENELTAAEVLTPATGLYYSNQMAESAHLYGRLPDEAAKELYEAQMKIFAAVKAKFPELAVPDDDEGIDL